MLNLKPKLDDGSHLAEKAATVTNVDCLGLENPKGLFESAEIGNAEAQYELGCLYFDNVFGMQKGENTRKAIELLRKSAYQGNGKAQIKLAWLYLGGDGVVQSESEAFMWISKACEQGHKGADKLLYMVQWSRDCKAIEV